MNGAVLALALVLEVGAAPVGVVLEVACGELDVVEVRRIVAIELRLRSSAEPGRGDEWATRVQAECNELELQLRVDDPLTRKQLTRTFDLAGSAPTTRSRLVALAIAELVLASWTELVSNPTPQAPPAGPAPPEALREGARDTVVERMQFERGGTRLWLTGGPHVFIDAALWGVGLRWALQPPGLFGFELDLRFDHGDRRTELGEVLADRVTASITPHLHFGRWRFGAGARAGAVRITGIAAQPDVRGHQGIAPWLGALLLGGVEATFGAFAVQLHAEVGVTALSVVGQAGGVEVLPLRGGWLALEVGLGVAP